MRSNLLLKQVNESDYNFVYVCVHDCRFTADAEIDLKEPLSALGVTDMFSVERADFRHLSE